MKPLIPFCLLTLLAFPALSQSRFSFGVKADVGLAGIEPEKFQMKQSSELTTSYTPGLSASMGLVGAYYFDQQKRLGVSVGLLSNSSTYTLQETHKVPAISSSPELRGESNSSNRFKLVNLLAPVKLTYRFEKASFSLGLLNTWHLFADLKEQSRFRNINPDTEWEEEFMFETSTGEVTVSDGGFFKTTMTFESRYTPQILLGVAFEISNTLSIGLEYTDYLRDNNLILEVAALDGTDQIREVGFRHNALTLSLTWLVEQQ